MEDQNLLLATLAEANPPTTAEALPPELDEPSPLDKIKAADQAREGFPGEHWLVLALGVALWQFTRKHPNFLVRAAGAFGATSLVARAASGREGLSKVLRWTPLGKGISNCPPCVENKAHETHQVHPAPPGRH
jgi:hypothetical protein